MTSAYHEISKVTLSLTIAALLLFGAFFVIISNWRSDMAYANLLKEASSVGVKPSFRSDVSLDKGAVNVPILVYHSIRPPFAGETDAIKKTTITPDNFEAEMKYLQKAGYRVIPFGDLERYLDKRVSLPPQSIIISFDDCWEDQFTFAFPILKKYRYTATFFIVTNYIDHRDFLTWNQVRQLSSAGMTIGSHSRSHPFLDQIGDPNRLESEIGESKQIIEQHLGRPLYEFAYPYGAFDQRVIALVKKMGYSSARADYPGIWHSNNDRYCLSAINAPNNPIAFRKRLSSAGA